MPVLLRCLLLTFAFVCFVFGVFVDRPRGKSLIAAGLALWVLVPLIDAFPENG